MTPDTPTADAAAPTRRSSRRSSAPTVPEEAGVLTRAELRRRAARANADVPARDGVDASTPASEPAAASSLAESVVADVAAAIVAETIGAPVDPASRRRLRRAADAVFAHVADDAAAIDEPVVAEPSSSGAAFTGPESCPLDEFEFAARLFSFTGETPIQGSGTEGSSAAFIGEPVAASSKHVAQNRRRRGVVAQRIATASFSVGVMAIVGLLAVGTTTPAAAVAAASSSSVKSTTDISAASTASTPANGAIQAFVASGASGATALDRPEHYKVASMAQIASDSGVTLFANTWVNDPTAPIQWPFPVGVPISAAFGSLEYASEFASPHNGVDLTPGAGAEIHAIAAGTVRIATEDGGDYGVTVVIDHIVDGQPVSTRYGHMQYGSLQVSQGQKVTAGQIIGKVGQTGKATGPHLHFEVILGGVTRIDPMPWMYAHTTGTHTVG